MQTAKHQQTSIDEYEEAVAAIGKIARYTHGVEISPKTQELWRQTMLMVYYIDKASDADGVSSDDLAAELDKFFQPTPARQKPLKVLSPQALVYAKFLKTNLSEEQKLVLLRNEKIILSICATYPSTTRAGDYAGKVMNVGQTLGEVFFAEASTADTSYPGFKDFEKFFHHASRISTIIDALTDLKDDYREGLVGVSPNLYSRLVMVARATPDTLSAARLIGPRKIYLLIKTTHQKNQQYLRQKSTGEITNVALEPAEVVNDRSG